MPPTALKFGCVSHSPLIVVRKRVPDQEARILEACAAFRARVEAFDPEVVVMLSNDHYAGFHYSNMPAFCVGVEAEAVADVGGTPGPLPVPRETAIALVAHLRSNGFDPAISYRMRVDHGFSQPLTRLLGGIDRWPLIPVFVSAFTQPFLSFGRVRAFGAEVGRFLATTGKRVLILGSGGLSHHPLRYYPTPDVADPATLGWQMDGERGGTMTEEAWFTRLDAMHHEGAQMVAEGKRTVAEMRLNPAFDQDVLDRIARGDLEGMDDWNHLELVEKAGIGSLEIINWVAARAAHLAAGGGPVTTQYDMVPDYAVGYALAEG
jgi:2,3-dihydroxyphenylpropionate 1,2-dioxygenase